MRVVALLPAATEITCALGAVDALVGISHACDYPPYATALPRVTRSVVGATDAAATIDSRVRERLAAGKPLFSIDVPLLASLQPDVILTQGVCEVCAVSEDEVRRIAARLQPVPAVVSLAAGDLQGILDDVACVGQALGMGDEAVELVAGLQVRMRAVHRRLKAAEAPRPRVAVVEWIDPPWSAGHWVPGMVARAGGLDVMANEGAPSRSATIDAVRDARPDVVVFAPCGYPLDRAAAEAQRATARKEWEWTAGVRRWVMDGNAIVSRPGPRVVTGIEQLACVLHPGLFGAPAPAWCAELS